MLITNLLVAGGVAYAGVKTVIGQPQRKSPQPPFVSVLQTVPTDAEETRINGSSTELRGATTLTERRQHAVAATAFWLAMGGLFFPPLTLVSIPMTVYSVVPILEAGGRSLYEEGRLRPSVINSILIVSTLLTEHYLSAATLTWLHHSVRQIGRQLQGMSEQVTTEITNELGDLAKQAMGGAPREVWVVNENIEMKRPFAEVRVGDVIAVNRGEFIPVDGVVVAGEATVNLILRTGNTTPLAVRAGDQVYMATIVTAGRIRVQVEQLPQSAMP